jgi:hypothetical protein
MLWWWKEVIDGNIRSKPPMRLSLFRHNYNEAIIPLINGVDVLSWINLLQSEEVLAERRCIQQQKGGHNNFERKQN